MQPNEGARRRSASDEPQGPKSQSEAEAIEDHQHWFEPIADHLGSAYLRYSFTKGTAQEIDFVVDALSLKPGDRVLDARQLPFKEDFDAAICLCEGAFGLMTADDENGAVLGQTSTSSTSGASNPAHTSAHHRPSRLRNSW